MRKYEVKFETSFVVEAENDDDAFSKAWDKFGHFLDTTYEAPGEDEEIKDAFEVWIRGVE